VNIFQQPSQGAGQILVILSQAKDPQFGGKSKIANVSDQRKRIKPLAPQAHLPGWQIPWMANPPDG